ncbi:hypothetical protein GCM10017044_10870 [Kordiimonas sediminis]|uniref:Uncharacterized protein n=1 Tax=Kordiimonas sediminis TaxID=1735581 RepID=A0A919AP97_9PROT|nr:hypothetical protein [Kordiimonas sediminis]GHF18184.1 hypothetical protein GCM10017044_10870 [Kordiimonas sediminis]
MGVYLKDPSATLDYSVDWADTLLAGETIVSAQWSVTPNGAEDLQLGQEYINGSVYSVFVAGGYPGAQYRLSCRVSTDQGRTMERSFCLRIGET